MATLSVTVLGAGGTTVSIPFTTADNAAAAQAALDVVSAGVSAGTLTQVNYIGGSTLPGAGTGVTTSQIGVLELGNTTVTSPFSVNNSGAVGLGEGTGYVSAVLGGAGDQGMLVGFGAENVTVVSGLGGSTLSSGQTVTGLGGAAIGNLGFNTQVFFGGSQNQEFVEFGPSQLGPAFDGFAPSADVWMDIPLPLRGPTSPAFPLGQTLKGSSQGTVDGSNGSTTVHLASVASNGTFHPFGQTLVVYNNGTGLNTIDLHSNTTTLNGLTDINGDVVALRGTSAVADTINAAGGADSLGNATGGTVLYALINTGSGFINGGGSNVIMYLTAGAASGVATLYGDAGSDNVQGINGLIVGGTHLDAGLQSTVNGVNFLYSGTVAGASTLVGGGTGDQVNLLGANDLMIAGLGNENLFAIAPNSTIQGVGVTTAIGSMTLPGAVPNTNANTLMDGGTGQETYQLGGGNTTLVLSQSGGGNLLQEGVPGATDSATIINFATGVDTISLANPGGGANYQLVTSANPQTVVGQADLAPGLVAGSIVTFGDGTTWTFTNVVNTSDFH